MSRSKKNRQPSFSGKSPPRKAKNTEVRPREYLAEDEVRQLMKAARSVGRHGHRDATLILITYRHGLRVSEAIALGWNEVDLRQGRLHVRRLKHGMPSVHPLRGPELRALRQLKRDPVKPSYVFVSERRSPLTDSAVRKLVTRAPADKLASHSLCIPTCFVISPVTSWPTRVTTRARSNMISVTRNIQHTVRYTQLSSQRFDDFWKD
jgi:type 1 fimbriae regulatory protein FimB/type 1 fimbriae regulatory protein FimE